MKKITKLLLVCLIFSLMQGCGSGQQKQAAESSPAQPPAAQVQPVVLKKDPRKIGAAAPAVQAVIDAARKKIADTSHPVLGYWVGQFGPKNKINITLAEFDGSKASGYSVCAGNYRPISGSVTPKGENLYEFVMNEPGDNKYDGRFVFSINIQTQELNGEWTPFKKTTSAKKYSLQKREFVYNPGAGQFPMASQRLLTEEDVINLLPEELTKMRNEIYARHGYSFQNQEMRYHFEAQDWYMPLCLDIRPELTDIEAQNIDLIYRYEKYLEDYYDDYGR